MTQHLKFETEKGASRSKWVAGGLVLLIVGWMGSGAIMPSAPEEEEAPRTAAEARRPVTVATQPSTAQPVEDVFMAEGQAEAKRDTRLRAEAGGTITELLIQKGQDVTAGTVLARIDAAQRAADLTRAEADFERAKRDYDNAQTLLERGVSTSDRVVAARSALAAAEAGLANARENIANLEITAPFDGRIEALGVEQGELVGAGSEVGRIVDLDPLTVTVQVPQQAIADLRPGMKAQVEFITGTLAVGQVDFVSTSADPQTRTFEAEISIPNPDQTIPAGLSAQVRIVTGETRAHFLSPAILSLDETGRLGVKGVGEENRVDFYPINIIRAQTDGVWVSGLPDELTMITIGQAFVSGGEVVDPQPASLLSQAEDTE